MPRYSADSFTPTVTYAQAREALAAMDDTELLRRLHHSMVPEVPECAWRPGEPENEFLPETLRRIAEQDLRVAYTGDRDPACDNFLATGYTSGNSRQYTLMILFDQDDPECDDEGENIYPHENANPVVRLRSLGVATEQPYPRSQRLTPEQAADMLRHNRDRDDSETIGNISMTPDATSRLYDTLTVPTGPQGNSPWYTTTSSNANVVFDPVDDPDMRF